jgi:hypothetical protein
MAMPRGIRLKKVAMYLVRRDESPGTRAIIIAPASGRKIMQER